MLLFLNPDVNFFVVSTIPPLHELEDANFYSKNIYMKLLNGTKAHLIKKIAHFLN